jgi:dolichol-phosphate mannosyltransferase
MVLKNSKYLIVDGNSMDRTVEVAKEMGAEILPQVGFGKGDALAQAIKHVNSDTIKYVVFIDADHTYPAKYVPEMIHILQKNPDVGMVTGDRFSGYSDSSGMKRSFYIGNRLLTRAQSLLTGMNLNDSLTGLRAVKWSILKTWEPKSKGFDIEVEMNQYIDSMGYKTLEIPIEYRHRLGDKKLRIRDGIMILKRIIIESFKRV